MKKRRKPELLVPAGSVEPLIAAVENGADAVYVGGRLFNARMNAGNFDDERMLQALDYAHARGVKVFVTMNTLIFDEEMEGAVEYAGFLYQAGVDALIVQDLGLGRRIHEELPDFPLHLSTQGTACDGEAVALAKELGYERVVLSRELSLAEMEAACRDGGLDIEVFVHGALCICYSGQCQMSRFYGGRSGNRGACAQPCRLPYEGVDENGKKISGHLLSPKDLCLVDRLGELIETGVYSFKVEGRMKSPEYVAVVTGVYARLLRERRGPTSAEAAALEAAFSRSGFTDGYWRGRTGPALFGVRPADAQDPKELFAAAKAAVEKGGLRTVPVTMNASFRLDAPCTLTVRDEEGRSVTVSGPAPERARNRAVTAQELADRLKKTGGSAYRCADVSVDAEDGISLPAAAVNALRRDALSQLSAARTAPPERRELPAPPPPEDHPFSGTPELTCSLSRPDQLTPELLACAPARICLPLEQIAGMDALPAFSGEYCAVLPRVWRDRDEPEIRALLVRAKALGISAALAGNLGCLPLLRGTGLALYGDFGLNVFNGRALEYLADKGFSSAALSFELRAAQLRDLPKVLPCEAIVYGRLPLMLTENCLIRNGAGCACETPHVLTDRTGAEFPLLPVWGHRTEIQNSRPLYLADRDDWKRLGLRYARLRFTDETPEECVRVFQAYRSGAAAPESFTRGLFDRGVE